MFSFDELSYYLQCEYRLGGLHYAGNIEVNIDSFPYFWSQLSVVIVVSVYKGTNLGLGTQYSGHIVSVYNGTTLGLGTQYYHSNVH